MNEADVLRLIVSLVLIVIMILGGAWLTRRAGWLRTGGNQAIKVISSQSLGGRAFVALVQVEDARLVVGITPGQISLLHTLPSAEAGGTPPAAPSERPSFAAALGNVLKGR